MEPSDKQMALIHEIEHTLDIKFEGTTRKEAWLWTQENLPKLQEYRAVPVTEKQNIAINNVERVLDIKFTGETKQEAQQWLSVNMPRAVESERRSGEEALRIIRSIKRDASNTKVLTAAQSPNRQKVEYMDLVDSFSAVPGPEELNAQIGILKLGLQTF